MKKIKRLINTWLANKGKISQFLSKIEDGVNFPISHIFWHIVNALAVLAIIGGILVFLYGLTPVFQRSIDKPEEISKPSLIQERLISESDVQNCIRKYLPKQQAPRPVIQKGSQKQYESPSKPTVKEPERPWPQISLQPLQDVISNIRFYTISKKNICKTPEMKEKIAEEGWTKEDKQEKCFEEVLNDTYEGKSLRKDLQGYFPYDSASQQKFVNQLAKHIAKYRDSHKVALFRTSRTWLDRYNNVWELFQFWESVDSILSVKTTNAPRIFSEFFSFTQKNPNMGQQFIISSLPVIALADSSDRLGIFSSLRSGYKKLGLDYNWWEKSTNRFLTLSNLHDAKLLKHSLDCYYALILDEKIDRDNENAEAERNYNLAVSEAHDRYEADVAAAKNEASARRAAKYSAMGFGGIMVGCGIGAIIILAFIFALFAILRVLVKMNKTIEELKGKIK